MAARGYESRMLSVASIPRLEHTLQVIFGGVPFVVLADSCIELLVRARDAGNDVVVLEARPPCVC